ncbi:PREDICTED: mannose/glucose-specific lectin-like [Ipomoea nil]|uniref:mannose/glucose-specific lectin-like n=1 Tax=Ipomoea nil TaxID=35883 RepID=UPI000900D921|nr:PREDICTED: mannose/glucose-specific lectin-like [Ipomoea nil]
MAAAIPMDKIAGPFGFSGGDFWSFRPVNKINQILIHYSGDSGDNPIALTFSSTRDDGSKDTIKVGGAGPERIIKTDMVNIDNADEHLEHISGTFGIHLDVKVLRSIKFTTNLKDYGPFGHTDGETFHPVHVVPNKIVGFLGRSGFYIDAIGTYNSDK